MRILALPAAALLFAAAQPAVPAAHMIPAVGLQAVAVMSVTVSVAATVDFGTIMAGSSKTMQLGTVNVTAQGQASWTATVAATNFTRTGGGGTIANSNITYWSGPLTGMTGPGLCTPGQATSSQAASLSTSRTAFRRTGSSGNNSCSWNPTVTVTVPSSTTAGTYTGTITHSAL